VIDSSHLMTGVLSGCVLIAAGLVPGLFWGLAEGVRNLLDSISSPYPNRLSERERVDPPAWLAVVGAVVIAATVLAYSSH
jgi:hypothetical protein